MTAVEQDRGALADVVQPAGVSDDQTRAERAAAARRSRTQWSIDNSAENGDIDKDKKPTVEQVANIQLAKEAIATAGGPVTIGNCKD
jgi:hypothetical protein